MHPTRRSPPRNAENTETIDPRVLALAVALAEVLRAPREAAPPVADDDTPRPLAHWAEAFGVAKYTLDQAAKSGRLVATIPAGKSRGRMATRAAVVAFLSAAPAAKVESAAPAADEYLRIVGGSR